MQHFLQPLPGLHQVLCWGVRDMKHYQWWKVNSPLVELECGGTLISPKQHIENASINPNFPDPVITADVVCAQTTCHCDVTVCHHGLIVMLSCLIWSHHGLIMMSPCDVIMWHDLFAM